jgi:hypothetical protein
MRLMGEITTAYKIFLGNLRGRDHFGDLSMIGMIILKRSLRNRV